MQFLKSNITKGLKCELISFSQSDIINNTLVIPACVEELNYGLKDYINRYEITTIKFEKGSNLKHILPHQFENCKSIKDIDLSNCQNLKTIGSESFNSCENLENIKISNCNKLEIIDKASFKNCKKLHTLDLEKCYALKYIEDLAFFGCISFMNVDLSKLKNLERIGDLAFYHCDNMNEILFPKTLKTIGKYLLANCYNLKEIDFSNSNLEYIPNFAFYNCEKLKNINFNNCNNLKGFQTSAFFRTRLNELNFMNCSNIKIIDGKHTIAVNKLMVDNNIIGDSELTFKDVFLGITEIEVYNQDNFDYSFDNCVSENSKLRILGLGLHTYALSKDINLSREILNVFTQKEELSILMQNYLQINNLINSFKIINAKDNNANILSFLRRIGYFNVFDNVNKSEIDSYKMLLAQNLIKLKVVNNIKSNENKIYIDKLLNEKANKISRSNSLTNLVEQFVEEKVLSLTKENQEKLLYEFSQMQYQYLPNLEFAKFFARNFDNIIINKIEKLDIKEKINKDFIESIDGKIRLFEIANDFSNILESSNKKVLTRKSKQKLELVDCEYKNLYQNVKAKNEELADLCGSAHLKQEEFEELQKIFEIAKTKKTSQILNVCPDDVYEDVRYEFIEKDNPIGLVLGNITNCCQKINDVGETCMRVGATDNNSAFITIKHKNKIIAQSWVWYDEEKELIAFDNVEVPQVNKNYVNLHEKSINECLIRMFNNFYTTMNKKGHPVKNIIIGSFNTDIDFLEKVYPLEINLNKMYKCSIHFEDKPCYSDINKEGQYIVYKNGKLCKKEILLKDYDLSL